MLVRKYIFCNFQCYLVPYVPVQGMMFCMNACNSASRTLFPSLGINLPLQLYFRQVVRPYPHFCTGYFVFPYQFASGFAVDLIISTPGPGQRTHKLVGPVLAVSIVVALPVLRNIVATGAILFVRVVAAVDDAVAAMLRPDKNSS